MEKYLLTLVLSVISFCGFSQSVSVNTDGSPPNPSAILDVKSTSKGFLLPRMTTAQRMAIVSPADGLQVFDTNTKTYWFYNGNAWTESATGSAINYWAQNGANIYFNSGNVGIGTNEPGSPLSFQNIFGKKISFWKVNSTSDFGIGISTGVLQIYTAGMDKIAFGYGNADNFHETVAFNSGTGLLQYPNVFGNKISFWRSGPNSDYGIGISTGILQIYTAGMDKIAFGYGNTDNFHETVAFNSGTGLLQYPNVFGNKISFWRSGPNSDYGIGIKTGVMQIFTAGFDKIAFGYGNTNDFHETMTFLTGTGQLGIGTLNPGNYKLAVNGSVRSKEIVVESNWADYVFDDNYELPSLQNVKKFIDRHKHLPEIPSAAEIRENGLSLGEIQKRMMAKIEELTLYLIHVNEKMGEQTKSLEMAHEKIEFLTNKIKSIQHLK